MQMAAMASHDEGEEGEDHFIMKAADRSLSKSEAADGSTLFGGMPSAAMAGPRASSPATGAPPPKGGSRAEEPEIDALRSNGALL